MSCFKQWLLRTRSIFFAGLLTMSIAAALSVVKAAEDDGFAGIDRAQQQWQEAYNAGGRVNEHYLAKALLFPGKGELIRGSSEIDGYYRQRYARMGKMTGMRTRSRFEATPNVVYELREETFEKGGLFRSLIAWSNLNGRWVREIEASVEAMGLLEETAEIDSARGVYEKLCAENDVEKFLKGIYLPQAVYYSKGALFKEFHNLAVAYDYFNIPGYEVKLKVLAEIRASADTAYEIGEYRMVNGRAKGLYIMIWQRDEAGEWRVLLDSNI